MKLSLSVYVIALTGHALHISLFVVSPLIATKYFILFGIPASCVVLTAPCSLFITYFFIRRDGVVYGHAMILQSLVVGVIMAGILWLVNLVPLHSNGVMSADVWNKVLGLSPETTLLWALLYGLAQWCVVWFSQRFFFHNFLLLQVVGCGGLVSWIFLLSLVYIGNLPLPIEVLLGTIFWFGIFSLSLNFGLFVLRSVVGKNWLKSKINGLFSPVLYGVSTWLFILFWLMLLLTNVVGVKCFTIKGYCFTTGLLIYPFTFVCTDLMSELYGKQQAKYAVWTGFIASVTMMVVVVLASSLPMYKGSSFSQKDFTLVFGFTPAIVLASMSAYIFSQLIDIYLFQALRIRTQGKHLWLRNNVGTIVSQFVDTLIFSCFIWKIWLEFSPSASGLQLDANYWYQLALNEYIGKVILALLDTPFVYITLKILKKYV